MSDGWLDKMTVLYYTYKVYFLLRRVAAAD